MTVSECPLSVGAYENDDNVLLLKHTRCWQKTNEEDM